MAEADWGYSAGQLNPYVARVLAREPIDAGQSVIGIFTILKSIAQKEG